MRESTKPTSTAVVAALTLALGLLATASRGDAKEPLDVDGTTWSLAPAAVKVKARAKGIGKKKLTGGENVTVTLFPGDTWSAAVGSGLVLSGSRTRKNEFSKRLRLTLDTSSASALATLFGDAIESAAAADGVDLTLSLGIERSKIALIIRRQRRAGTATAKLKAKFKLTGTASAPGVGSVPGSVRAVLRGISLPIAFGE
jgi:hypothetical protein